MLALAAAVWIRAFCAHLQRLLGERGALLLVAELRERRLEEDGEREREDRQHDEQRADVGRVGEGARVVLERDRREQREEDLALAEARDVVVLRLEVRREQRVRAEGEEADERRGSTVCQVATLNVDGRMKLQGRHGHASAWGDGSELDAMATEEWAAVESLLQGKGVVALTDVGWSGSQLKAAIARLEASSNGAWRCHGTPGRFCPADGDGGGV